MITLTLDDLGFDKTALRGRINRHIRIAKEEGWEDDEPRWISLHQAKENLNRSLTRKEVEEVLSWGMTAPMDHYALEIADEFPVPVVNGAIRRERQFYRAIERVAAAFKEED